METSGGWNTTITTWLIPALCVRPDISRETLFVGVMKYAIQEDTSRIASNLLHNTEKGIDKYDVIEKMQRIILVVGIYNKTFFD